MKKLTKLFEVNSELTNYTYPVIKILGSLIVLFILINRSRILKVLEKEETIVVTVLAFILTVACIYCIYISIAEISEFHDRRVDMQKKVDEAVTKPFLIEEILDLVDKEDVLELEIKVQQKIVKIGCTSDNRLSTNEFFNKAYYCGEVEYESLETFGKVIRDYTTDGILDVITIDGIIQ